MQYFNHAAGLLTKCAWISTFNFVCDVLDMVTIMAIMYLRSCCVLEVTINTTTFTVSNCYVPSFL